MALNIKDPETDNLARELADLTGASITEAVKGALSEKLAAERKKRDRATFGRSGERAVGNLNEFIDALRIELAPVTAPLSHG